MDRNITLVNITNINKCLIELVNDLDFLVYTYPRLSKFNMSEKL